MPAPTWVLSCVYSSQPVHVTGSWKLDFYIAAAMAIVAGLIAIVLRNPAPAAIVEQPPPITAAPDSTVVTGREASR